MFRNLFVLVFVISLCGCSFARSDAADEARHKMRSLTKEQILICMGPPKQRAKVNETEVWSYASTNGGSSSYGVAPSAFGYGEHYKSNCTVNVVMKNDQVVAVHYNGPSGGWFDSDEQCYYAVQHCVDED